MIKHREMKCYNAKSLRPLNRYQTLRSADDQMSKALRADEAEDVETISPDHVPVLGPCARLHKTTEAKDDLKVPRP